jgi:hypothetical protein
MTENDFYLIFCIIISSVFSIAICDVNRTLVGKITEKKWVRIIIHIIFGTLLFVGTFMATYTVLLRNS